MTRLSIAMVCLLPLLACGQDPRHIPEPMVPASGACPHSLVEVQEALFRYMFDHNESAFQKEVSYYFLQLPADVDPGPELLARFESHVPVVKPLSQGYLKTDAKLRALFFGIDRLECTDDDTATAVGGYYESGSRNVDHVYRVIRKNGNWVIVEDRLLSAVRSWSEGAMRMSQSRTEGGYRRFACALT